MVSLLLLYLSDYFDHWMVILSLLENDMFNLGFLPDFEPR